MQLLLLLVLAADPTFAILTPRMHHDGEVKKPGQGWHGLVAADHHYNLTTVRLFLSSKAKKGHLVREVAKFSTSGC